ncbi:MAG: FecR domain-containing protein [Parcubacteria group bacterium]|nr:FecR domain-containing protein [Parcubacteria group bacterium]
MSFKKIGIGIGILAIVFGLGWMGYTSLHKGQQAIEQPLLKPWVEVVAPSVFVSSADGSVKRELKTGDEVDAGALVEVKKGGEANIYFPDGSVARLDTGTKITIDAASYDPKSKALVVKVQLLIGRVWSKIFSLATPESTWEVKTSNAVATVRGTAFGMAYDPKTKQSRVVGGEHKVSVGMVNKGVVVRKDVAVIEEHKTTVLTDEIVQRVVENNEPVGQLVVVQDIKDAPKDVGVWVEESSQKDIKTKIEQEGLSPSSNDFRQNIINNQANQPVIKQENNTATTSSSEIVPEFKALRISYEHNDPNKEIPVDSSVSFKAFLVRTDSSGQDRDVTGEVEWRVRTSSNVSIGTITKQGVFTAQLDENSSEQTGSGEGFITASWKDQVTGSIFRAQTQILKVFIPETPIPPGAID